MEFERIVANYDRHFRPLVARVQAKYDRTPARPNVDVSLEAHLRAYVVNALLAALNWRMDIDPDAHPGDRLPNLVPEAPLRSRARGTRRFLDYLGIEGNAVERPLMIVETKRPSAELPATAPSMTVAEVISRGLSGKRLAREWSSWLADLREYVRSMERVGVPRRVVITNGDWLVVFMDPADAFLEGGTASPLAIAVWTSKEEIKVRYVELFGALEHSRVLGKAVLATPGQAAFLVNSAEVSSAMHGLRVRYGESGGIEEPDLPEITVSPVVWLGTRFGSWLCIGGGAGDHRVPRKASLLPEHLTEVENAATRLLAEVNAQLGTALVPMAISEHYKKGMSALAGFQKDDLIRDAFVVVTGNMTHYIRGAPSVRGCPWHDWATAREAKCEAGPAPILTRSVRPRAFFVSSENHHCAHGAVRQAKESPITSENQRACGSRSGKPGQAFCEIWRLETYLCCRTCVFESVCTDAEVFRLPCQVERMQASAPTSEQPVKADHMQPRIDGGARSPQSTLDTPMMRDDLLTRLSKLLPSQFEEVLFRARIPTAHLPGAGASQVTRAIDVIHYLEQKNQLDQLARLLEEVATGPS